MRGHNLREARGVGCTTACVAMGDVPTTSRPSSRPCPHTCSAARPAWSQQQWITPHTPPAASPPCAPHLVDCGIQLPHRLGSLHCTVQNGLGRHLPQPKG